MNTLSPENYRDFLEQISQEKEKAMTLATKKYQYRIENLKTFSIKEWVSESFFKDEITHEYESEIERIYNFYTEQIQYILGLFKK